MPHTLLIHDPKTGDLQELPVATSTFAGRTILLAEGHTLGFFPKYEKDLLAGREVPGTFDFQPRSLVLCKS